MEEVAEYEGHVTAHTLDGWSFTGDEHRWFLTKRFGEHTAHIRGTDTAACAWNIISGTDRVEVLAADRSLDRDDAKVAVARWIREHS